MKKNILITGGANFLGFFLAEALIRDGHSVRIFDAKKPSRIPENVDFLEGDTCHRDIWQKALLGIEVVIHAASMSSSSEDDIANTTAKNVHATANMLDVLSTQKNNVKSVARGCSIREGSSFKKTLRILKMLNLKKNESTKKPKKK